MRAVLVMTMLASAAVFADEEPQHVEEGETLALDCPMVDIRIQGGLTEMQPEVYTWEECGACQNVLKYKCNKNLSSIHLSGWGECEKYLRYIYNIVFFSASICLGVPACKFWTLSTGMAPHNYCYLWSSMLGKSETPNSISGERECSG